MDGIHDLGGKPGYGMVNREDDEAIHDRWEAAVLAITAAGRLAGAWTSGDRFRHAIERIEPEAYLTHTYYGRWLGGAEALLVEAGLVTQEEITERVISMGGSADDLVAARPKLPPDPMGPERKDRDNERVLDKPARFRVGEKVVTTGNPVPGHTRLPAYARNRTGEVTAVHGGWVYPDTMAHGKGENPQHLYTVTFTSEVLWQSSGFTVSLDLFEPYLIPLSPSS